MGSGGDRHTNGHGGGHAAPSDPGSGRGEEPDQDDDAPENVEDLLGIALPTHEAGPAPAEVAELAAACERIVERAVGVRPDYTLETLPLVDHWLEGARGEVAVDVTRVIVQAGGAYFGEVVRRRHPSWWALGNGDPAEWEIQFESTYLSLRPVEVVREALRTREVADGDESFEDPAGDIALLDIDEDDRAAVVARLAELPEVSEAEYRSLATLIEVIDIAVETARSRRMGAEEPEPSLEPEDYQR
ncbi:MAG: hypothetical protein WKG00_31205 [Polyangiaceae bacterium]